MSEIMRDISSVYDLVFIRKRDIVSSYIEKDSHLRAIK